MAADKKGGAGRGGGRRGGGGDKLNPWKIQGYKPGQNVICKVMRAEPGGYSVLVVKDNLPGYLPSNALHNRLGQTCNGGWSQDQLGRSSRSTR
jgi:hypothetical protein